METVGLSALWRRGPDGPDFISLSGMRSDNDRRGLSDASGASVR